MRKLESINECRGYLGVFVGKARADAMSGFELAAAVRQHGAELAPTVSFETPAPPARADSATAVYREDENSKTRRPDRRADAYANSFLLTHRGLSSSSPRSSAAEPGSHPGPIESLSGASMRETREKAALPLPGTKRDKRGEAYAASFSPEAKP
jgi:hypothetical protein